MIAQALQLAEEVSCFCCRCCRRSCCAGDYTAAVLLVCCVSAFPLRSPVIFIACTSGDIWPPIVDARPSATAAKICRSCPLSVRLTFAKQRERECCVAESVRILRFRRATRQAAVIVLCCSSLGKCRSVELQERPEKVSERSAVRRCSISNNSVSVLCATPSPKSDS